MVSSLEIIQNDSGFSIITKDPPASLHSVTNHPNYRVWRRLVGILENTYGEVLTPTFYEKNKLVKHRIKICPARKEKLWFLIYIRKDKIVVEMGREENLNKIRGFFNHHEENIKPLSSKQKDTIDLELDFILQNFNKPHENKNDT